MHRSRWGLLAVSMAVVLLILGGGLALRAGAAEGAYRQVIQFSEVLGLVLDNYVDAVDQQSLLTGAYEGLMGGLDAHGAYLTPSEVQAWKKTPAADAVDAGFSVLKSGGVLQIVAVAPGSPAEAAKLVPGDQIRRVDGRSVRNLSLDQALRALSGPAGSSVDLSLIRPHDNFKKEDLTLHRSARSDPPYAIDVVEKTVVLRVRDLKRLQAEALEAQLAAARQSGSERLLVDLRNLASGGPRDAVALATIFVSGDLFRLKDRTGKSLETLSAGAAKARWSAPVGVLVNGGTAGGGEGFARVLQSRGAKVYGESTYGLGAEPKLIELPDGAGLLLSVFVWETAEGQRWNGDGVEPDRVIRADGKPDDAEADQLRKTLEEFEKNGSPAAPAKAA